MQKPTSDGWYSMLAILGMGVAILAFTVPGIRAIHDEQQAVREEISDLRDRTARLEGLFEGYTARFDQRSPP